MDDLNDKLTRLLSSPDSLSKIQSMMAALGGETAPPVPAAPEKAEPIAVETGGGLPDLATLAKLAPLLSNMGREDEETRLLWALRPYVHGPREQRLEEAVRLLRLTKLLPLLQESGGLLGGKKEAGSHD